MEARPLEDVLAGRVDADVDGIETRIDHAACRLFVDERPVADHADFGDPARLGVPDLLDELTVQERLAVVVDAHVADTELGITHLRVHNYGEPFVDRKLVEKVRYAKQKGIQEVGMISNGSLITEQVAQGMIDAGLDAINISVDAGGKDVFEQTRIGLNYDKVIANVERLSAFARNSASAGPS